MRFLSVCSGIEAASVAFAPLGWSALAFAEIEPFPRALLTHRYRDAPLHGDFTLLRDEPWIVGADLLCGGTPCQAFSIAGLRGSLGDARGNLTLEFVRLADAIDDLRRDAGREPAWILWENVPGVLSVADNAFGAFLAGLVGHDAPIEPPPGRGWTDAGVVHGPRRVAAWRVLDAQHFGLAQRRKRVFVLAREHPRGWGCADALLPVIESLQGHPAPRREAGQRTARPIAAGSQRGSGYRNDADTADNLIAGTLGQRSADHPSGLKSEADFIVPVIHAPDLSPALKARDFKGPSSDGDGAPLIATAGPICFSAKDHGADAAEDIAPTLRAGGHAGSHANAGVMPAVAFSIMPQNSGKDYKARKVEVAQPIMAGGNPASAQGGDVIVQPVPFDTTQLTSAANRSSPKAGDPCHPLAAGAHPPAVAFAHPIISDADREESAALTPSPDAEGRVRLRDPGLGVGDDGDPMFTLQATKPHAVAFALRGREGGAMPEVEGEGDSVGTLRAADGGSSRDYVATTAGTLSAAMGRRNGQPNDDRNMADLLVAPSAAVRRLTPEECEKLQGFPPLYTQIPWRGKPAAECPDGPRYKALGNSWAVPVVRWIGERIAAVEAAASAESEAA